VQGLAKHKKKENAPMSVSDKLATLKSIEGLMEKLIRKNKTPKSGGNPCIKTGRLNFFLEYARTKEAKIIDPAEYIISVCAIVLLSVKDNKTPPNAASAKNKL